MEILYCILRMRTNACTMCVSTAYNRYSLKMRERKTYLQIYPLFACDCKLFLSLFALYKMTMHDIVYRYTHKSNGVECCFAEQSLVVL